MNTVNNSPMSMIGFCFLKGDHFILILVKFFLSTRESSNVWEMFTDVREGEG